MESVYTRIWFIQLTGAKDAFRGYSALFIIMTGITWTDPKSIYFLGSDIECLHLLVYTIFPCLDTSEASSATCVRWKGISRTPLSAANHSFLFNTTTMVLHSCARQKGEHPHWEHLILHRVIYNITLCYAPLSIFSRWSFSLVFSFQRNSGVSCSQQDGWFRTILNQRYLNTFIKEDHFRMEKIWLAASLMEREDYMVTMDLQVA